MAREGQIKYLIVGLGCLSQFAALVYMWAMMRADIYYISKAYNEKRPVLERFLAIEPVVKEHERRLQTCERYILRNWSGAGGVRSDD
jgi:hypothetical protein